jgi:hypothetical protein
MPPRIPRVAIGPSKISRRPITPQNQQICLFCSLSRSLQLRRRQPQTQQLGHRIRARRQLNIASATVADDSVKTPSQNPRSELRDALLNLQKQAGSYINISRLQLALRGLEQPAGDETIRIAILGLEHGGDSMSKAKELLRILVADPLKTEEEWEQVLTEDQQGGKPLLLKVGLNGTDGFGQSSRLVQELNVSSPMLNGHKLEILVLEMDPPSKDAANAVETFTNAVLVPTMEIPTSNTGRYTPVTTPVHKSLIVADGILGASSLLSYPIDIDRDVIGTAVDFHTVHTEEDPPLPFQTVNIALGSEALVSFRQSVDNATDYEQGWFASGVPEILDWLKSGTHSTGGSMKPPLRKLIESLLRNTGLAIRAEQTRQLSRSLSAKVSSLELDSLKTGLSEWAERAHTELRDQLDIAFEGRRWQKLGWWKLFWRVDDVSMIASDILNQRFLADAEKEVIFLAGRIEEAGIFRDGPIIYRADWAYKPVSEEFPEPKLGSEPPPPRIQDLIESPKDDLPEKFKPQPWPLHIPVTRVYLAMGTIPELQALAQKLVFQTLTTSSFASIFAGLMYVSSLSTGLYEAGAVAALGIVWSLRRMQGKWETARSFWEGEVREEGRKAVRGVEGAVAGVLSRSSRPVEEDQELKKAQEAVEQAETALVSTK